MDKLYQIINFFLLDRELGATKKEFFEQISLSNLSNIKKLVFILALYHVAMLAIDYANYRAGLWGLKPGYQYLFYSHVAFFIIAIGFFLPLLITRYIKRYAVFPWYNSLTNVTILAIFIWCACVSSIDQLIHDQITVYILAVFGAATFCSLSNLSSVVIYGLPSVVFFTGITWLQSDQDVLQGHYINGAILIFLGWVIGRVMFYGKVQEYKSRKTIEQQNAMLEKMSIEDSLTGLHNRRYLQEFMEKCLASAERFGQALTFAITDIDHFKAVNDNYSHQIGDDVLKVIAGIFSQNIRKSDDVARYGGEEFIFVLDRTDAANASRLCEKIRKRVESYDWDSIAPGLRVTISFGLAEAAAHATFDEIFRDADRKLYEAKKSGRNCVRY